MPDFDSGHIFLTTLAPIKLGAPKSSPQYSYEQRLRKTLASLPTARQSPATAESELQSPFSENLRNHLVRLFVLDDIVYNGRNPQNPVIGQLRGDNPSISQNVDRLNSPYFVFCADIDAITKDHETLPRQLTREEQKTVRMSYAKELWSTMQEEMEALYSNCVGFDDVRNGDDFAQYLEKCHVETTMPFHDYYLKMPALKKLPIKSIIFTLVAPLLVGIISFLIWLFGFRLIPFVGWSSLLTSIGAIAVFAIGCVIAWKYVMINGSKPFPPGEYDDLPSVLKALYIQQKFSDFYIENQGSGPEALYQNFKEFLNTNKPEDVTKVTQEPGVISSKFGKSTTQ